MYLEWEYSLNDSQLLKDFIREKALPRKFITSVKYQGGSIQVNGQPVTVREVLNKGDIITIIPPTEYGHDSVIPSNQPIDIVYEDRDILVINKPTGIVSIPSFKNPDQSIANHVKGYYVDQNYEDQVIHIVTRLDRDTSGLMLIAKHRLAHAFFDRLLQKKALHKRYLALSSATHWDEQHGFIDVPISRHPESLIQRVASSDGQPALSEYHVLETFRAGSLLLIQLHTGRTHQIRVHLQSVGGALIGDTLYGQEDPSMKRQALHCYQLEFVHPFTGEQLVFTQSMPQDIKQWCQKN